MAIQGVYCEIVFRVLVGRTLEFSKSDGVHAPLEIESATVSRYPAPIRSAVSPRVLKPLSGY